MEDIMELARSEAMLFKFGSGTGTDLSTLRSHREKLAGGGKPSGPLSFMRVYDQIAAVVKSGGKTRRAAKMQSLKVWHPDVMEFIECKWKEEKKARVLIEKGGYESNFNGEAYSSIMFQNANLSVRVTDDFMQAVENDEIGRPTGSPTRTARPDLAGPRSARTRAVWFPHDPPLTGVDDESRAVPRRRDRRGRVAGGRSPLEHLRRLRTLRRMTHQCSPSHVIISEIERLKLNRERRSEPRRPSGRSARRPP